MERTRSVLSDLIFPRPVFSSEEKEEAEAGLWQMEGAFEAVLTADWALYEFLRALEIQPDVLLGHSTGEYAAMRAAGMLNIETDADVVEFAAELNRFHYSQGGVDSITRSSLIAVGAGFEEVSSVLDEIGGVLRLAMDNCPHQTVVVGSEGDAAKLLEEAGRRGWICERLSFDRPYHTPMFESYSEELREFLAKWIVRPPQAVLYSCTSSSTFPEGVDDSRDLAVRHWMRPVEFRRTIEKMYEDGVRIFVEAGPRGNLCAFVDDILRGRSHLAMPADTANRSSMMQLNHLVGALAVNGVSMRLERLYESRGAERILLEELGSETKARRKMKLDVGWIPMGLSDEVASRIRSKRRPVESVPESAPVVTASSARPLNRSANRLPPDAAGRPRPDAPQSATPSEDVMSAYWRTMKQFLSVQKEVMEGFLVPPSIVQVNKPALVAPRPVESSDRSSAAREGVTSRAAPLPETSEPDEGVDERTSYPVEMIDLDLDLEAESGSFQQHTESLQETDVEALSSRRTPKEVIEFLDASSDRPQARPEPPGKKSKTHAAMPFLRSIESFAVGQELEARCELDLKEDLFLHDHVLGRRPSASDSSLRGLPVVPFTMGMEMLAEAGSALEPGQKVVGLRDVRIFRWMTLDKDKLRLRLVARRETREGEVVASVQVFEETAGDNGSPRPSSMPWIEGKVVLAHDYQKPPRASEMSLAGERPSTWTTERLYEDIMFHGPLFRGVASMDKWGEDGAIATLRVLPPCGLFASTDEPALATDPVLLDQPGQVVGFWMAEHLESGYVVFPYQLDAIELYAAPGQMTEELQCRARIALVGDELVDSDLDLVDADDRVLCRFRGWKDRRFDLPRRFLRFLHRPGDEVLSERLPVRTGSQILGGRRIDVAAFPKNFFTAHRAIWQRALAHLVLSRRERQYWRDDNMLPPQRLLWLLGRVAAKDAVRSHLSDRYGITATPAEIEIVSDASGYRVAGGAWAREIPFPLTLSVSQSNGTFVAVVSDPSDLEPRDVDGGNRLVPQTREHPSSTPVEPIGE